MPRDACISAVYAVVRCRSVTFVYCVETAQDMAIVALKCEIANRTPYFKLSTGTTFKYLELLSEIFKIFEIFVLSATAELFGYKTSTTSRGSLVS